jgi:hypothetical protein
MDAAEGQQLRYCGIGSGFDDIIFKVTQEN